MKTADASYEGTNCAKKYYLYFIILQVEEIQTNTLCKKCPYLELFWFAFSGIRTEYGKILRIFSYSVQMRENADQNNSEYEHLLRSVKGWF